MRQRDELVRQFNEIATQIDDVRAASICGANDESQHVEQYDGSLGVSRQFVDMHQGPVGQLQWLDNLAQQLDGPTSPGTVSGARSGTGALIESFGNNDLFLTAGHCFDPATITSRTHVVPTRLGIPLDPHELATLMQVNFNFQLDPRGQARPVTSFPIVELVDYGLPGLDYALVRLGTNKDGKRASEMFGKLRAAKQDVTGGWLCMIQHPNGLEKKIAAGPLLESAGGRISYNSLDAQNGSSGAPVLAVASGEIVGVHIAGGCEHRGGFNVAQAIGVIRAASRWIK